jgi:predicted metal-dependent phosphoesterase TrpH
LARAKKIVKKLSDHGVMVSWNRVSELSAGGSVGRPHIAYALVELGYVHNPKDAFDSLIGVEGPGFVPRSLMSTVEAVELLTNNGALPVLAHPLMSKAKSGRKDINGLHDLIPALKKAGLIGIEVHYGDYSTDQIRNLNCISQKFGLVPCGGSDYHAAGNPVETEPGDMGPTLETVENLKRMKSILRPLQYE